MTSDDARAIRDQAALLASHLSDDVGNALTRNEHIRLVAHATEAAHLVAALDLVISMLPAAPEPVFTPTHLTY